MYRIHQIKLGLKEKKDVIPGRILKKIGGKDNKIKNWNIVKESLDARDKKNIMWTYSVDFELDKQISGTMQQKMKQAHFPAASLHTKHRQPFPQEYYVSQLLKQA